jgi:hypothetical protein
MPYMGRHSLGEIMIYAKPQSNGELSEIFEIFELPPEGIGDDFVEITQDIPPYTPQGLIYAHYYWDGTNAQHRGAAPSEYHIWSYPAWTVDRDLLNQVIRRDRDILLVESDWTQLPDSPLTTEKKTEWATYRQALRDVPANSTTVADLDAVSWPTKPS